MDTELKVLNTASAFNVFAVSLFGPFFAVFVKGIGGSAFAAGTAYSVYAIAAGVLMLVASRFEESRERMDLLLVSGYGLSTLAFTGYLFVETPLQLAGVQGLLGVATAIQSPAFDELYSKNLDTGHEALQWGVWESMYWIVTGSAALIGGFIVDVYGFSMLFTVMAGLSLLATAAAGRLMWV